MPQQIPHNATELMDRGMVTINGLLDGSISSEKGRAMAELLAASVRLAKAEVELHQAAAKLDMVSG